MRQRWNEFWFRPSSRLALDVTRIILVLQSLWILLSRPALATVVKWPDVFWSGVPQHLALRFGLTRSFAVEESLYVAAIIALLLSLTRRFSRPACFASALLLYHLAPLEEIITASPLTMFRGLTQPLFGLLFVAVARPSSVPSFENRWPVAGAQLSMALTYFLAALSKLHDAGIAWAVGPNVRAIAVSFWTWGVRAPWAPWLIHSDALCWVIAIGTMAVELAFPVVLVSRSANKVLVPLAAISHLVIVESLGVFFLSVPLLLLFVDWEWVAERFGRRVATAPATT